ncbi:S41 family peptidase [Nonomuraea sp. NPDC050310]|uniref:S41 family peptidase n=1 Tax=Nonomuraea sp. NPDC050310 TaxID=3154935 RepID=UPI0033F04C71
MTVETITLQDTVAAVPLARFLATAGRLAPEGRRAIAEQALLVLERNYVNLPLKTTRYAINPVQRLRLLLARLRPETPEWEFHAELVSIFNSLRDLHTRYSLPAPFSGAAAFLPFRIKDFAAGGRRRYLYAPDGRPPPAGRFRPGVELLRWNGVPMDRAVQLYADRLPGANPAARHARAVDTFTVRSLAFGGPPDEEFILIDFLDLDGEPGAVAAEWLVPAGLAPAAADGSVGAGRTLAVDIEGRQLARLRTLLFAPHIAEQQDAGATVVAGPGDIPVSGELAEMFEARVLTTPSGDFGHLRIRSFHPDNLPGDVAIPLFVNEFIRLLGQMPPAGVILDIRGNGGGYAEAAELCLQALTPGPLASEPLQFLSSELNLRICRSQDWLGGWVPSLEQAIETGSPYSAGLPITDARDLARVPQSYLGPLVLLTDARSYSAADIFAAGFQDHRLGPVIGTDPTTGAGGAAVWKHTTFLQVLNAPGEFPYRPLPGGAGLSVAIMRLLRVGPAAGVAIEDFGVAADLVHATTRDDVLHGSRDLFARAGAELSRGVRRSFEVTLGTGDLQITAEGVDRADVYVDGRPRASVDVDGVAKVSLDLGSRPIRVEGFSAGRLVAVRRFEQGELVTSLA